MGKGGLRVGGWWLGALLLAGAQAPGCRTQGASEPGPSASAHPAPEVVRRVLLGRHPRAALISVGPSDTAGVFEGVLEEQGRRFVLAVDGEGRVLARREAVELSQVPEAARRAFQSDHPDVVLSSAEVEVRTPHGASSLVLHLVGRGPRGPVRAAYNPAGASIQP